MLSAVLIEKTRNVKKDAEKNDVLEKQTGNIRPTSNIVTEMIEVVVDPLMWSEDIVKTELTVVMMILRVTKLRSSEMGRQMTMNVLNTAAESRGDAVMKRNALLGRVTNDDDNVAAVLNKNVPEFSFHKRNLITSVVTGVSVTLSLSLSLSLFLCITMLYIHNVVYV